MRRSRREGIYLLLGIVLLTITLGYAYLQTNLSINGTTNVSSANWNIYWDNIVLGSNNVTDITTPATINTGKTEVTFNVNFKEPGDTYEFTVDALNDGTIDAMIDTFSKGVYAINGTTPKTLPDYLEYTVTYSDAVAIQQNHLLSAGTTETYKVRVHYKEDITATQLPSTADNYVFKFGVTYKQADDNAIRIEHPVSFAEDKWSTIISAVQSGNTSFYHVGDTKEVDMGTFGTHTLRIANTSTPAECSTEGFSQTACGFVLEFADLVTLHVMNSESTNVGGWPATEMRTYINTDIYNAIPETIRNAIVETNVVSGHGNTTGEENFISTDKLYLLSLKEIGISSTSDSARDMSRVLDYYEINNSGVARYKTTNLDDWWLRTPYISSNDTFFIIYSGYDYYRYANSNYGVSPAFRIG